MNKLCPISIALSVALFSFSASAQDSSYESKLNTANTIRAAFELRRLVASLAPGVDTRCYIAKLAASQAVSLPQAASVIANHPSGNKQSDAFAIQSTNQTMEIYKNNRVQEIARECQSSS